MRTLVIDVEVLRAQNTMDHLITRAPVGMCGLHNLIAQRFIQVASRGVARRGDGSSFGLISQRRRRGAQISLIGLSDSAHLRNPMICSSLYLQVLMCIIFQAIKIVSLPSKN